MNRSKDLSSLWMVPYADLMTTLVMLFLALFAYAYANKSPEYDRALAHLQEDLAQNSDSEFARARSKETEVAVKVKQALDSLALKDFGLRVTENHVHLLLPEPVLFSEGSALLNPGAAKVLGPLAKVFAEVPNPILIKGHTDDRPLARGRWRNNWELSAARAFSVSEFFIQQGLDPLRFHVRGYSEQRPAASNLTPEGRSRNRRIELSMIREIRKEE